ncbi:MAG: biotin/lipoyl-containing protein, partial [Rhodanobacteraceae bacterium]
MANTVEVKVPDIGNYSDVPVIEVLVKAGDTVAKDQSLVTLESDKATMEVPSSVAGVVKEVRVKVDGTVSEGDVVAVIEASDSTSAAATPLPLGRAAEAAAQSAAGEG